MFFKLNKLKTNLLRKTFLSPLPIRGRVLGFVVAFFLGMGGMEGMGGIGIFGMPLYAAKKGVVEATGVASVGGSVRLGFVDIQQVMLHSSQGKKVKSELENFFQEKKKGLEAAEKDLKVMQQDLEKKRSVLSDAVFARKQKNWEKKMLAYREQVNETQLQLQKRERNLAGPILKNVKKIITKMGEKEGYTMILQRSPMSNNLLWAKKKVNLTSRVIAQLEKKRKKKGEDLSETVPSKETTAVKLGFVNLQRVMLQSSQGKKVKSELEKLFKKKKKELEAAEKDLKAMQQDLEKKRSVLSDSVFAQKQRDWEIKMLSYRKKVSETQLRLQKREKDLTGPILKNIRDIIGEIGKKGDYTMILQRSPLSDNLLWAKAEVDLTSKVITQLNKKKRKK